MIDLERDLIEAREIFEGRTLMIPEIRHLKAMQNHFDDSLIVLALKAARLHDDIMAAD